MRGYELTERGKIFIAFVIVLVLFVLPAALILYSTVSAQPRAPAGNDTITSESPPASVAETPPPETTNSPPPNGGGFNPPGDNGNPGETDPPEELDPSPPPEYGPSGGNPSGGTLSFLFSPDKQDAIDDETMSSLGIFLSSHMYLENSKIAVEMPELTGETAEKTKSAILSAFASFRVPERRLVFIVDLFGVPESTFEIHLSYISSQLK